MLSLFPEDHITNRRLLSLLVPLLAWGLSGVPVPARAADPYAIDYVIRPYNPSVLDSWFFGINDRGQSTGYVWTLDAQGALVQSPVIYRGGDVRPLASGSPGSGFLANTGLAINTAFVTGQWLQVTGGG